MRIWSTGTTQDLKGPAYADAFFDKACLVLVQVILELFQPLGGPLVLGLDPCVVTGDRVGCVRRQADEFQIQGSVGSPMCFIDRNP